MEITDNENRELKAQVDRLSAMVETLIANQAAQAAQLQTAQAQVAESQDAQIQAQAQAAEMRNQMLTARLQAEEAQARAQVHNSGQSSAQNQPQIQNQTTAAPVTTVIASEINAIPVTSVTITASHPWEIPRDLNQDRYQQEFVPPNAPVFTNVPPICGTCSVNSRGCRKIQDDLQGVLDQGLIQISRQVSSPESQEQEVNVIIPCFNIPEKVEIAYHSREPVVICPPGPMPYTSDKAVPYRYAATIIENGKEVEIKTLASVTNIAANSRMTRSGRVFALPVIPSRNVEKDPVVVVPVIREEEGQTSNSTLDKETDELLRIIKLIFLKRSCKKYFKKIVPFTWGMKTPRLIDHEDFDPGFKLQIWPMGLLQKASPFFYGILSRDRLLKKPGYGALVPIPQQVFVLLPSESQCKSPASPYAAVNIFSYS
ncbi:hypothetical protein KIW84_034360 [Lathyrus oleraceus]|uniref:Uncharacterized protein n=1 Tax=Pisum sativum TaxID=3888 RepID=A0A9D5B132_PEA|nr:hypothetical protein KIW84_034360 [Pisum sativum]